MYPLKVKTVSSSYWIRDIALGPTCLSVENDGRSDVAIIGGGFSGLWTALEIKKISPESRVTVFEKYFCGQGPSGRNGGIVYDLWEKIPLLLKYLERDQVFRLAKYAENRISFTPDIMQEMGVDADFVRNGAMHVSTSSFHDNKAKEKLRLLQEFTKEDAAVSLSKKEVSLIARSPRFRGGIFYPGIFTMHPAKMIRGLRTWALREGVEIFEGTAVENLEYKDGLLKLGLSGGFFWEAEKVLLANGCPDQKIIGNSITVSSSHMVVTEPVPDVLAAIGWTGGEAITDERNTVHYMRTTKDKRIAFGFGAGKIQPYGQPYQLDQEQIGVVVRDLLSFFPGLIGKKIAYAWGGPVDISPTHLPFIEQKEEGLWQIGGHTGAGAGMSIIFASVLARNILEINDPVSKMLPPKPPPLPPEPLRAWAGSLVRQAMLRKEESEEREKSPDLISRAIVSVPSKLGMHIGR